MKIVLFQLFVCSLLAKVIADLRAEIDENIRALLELWKSGEIHDRLPFEVPRVEPFVLPPFCQNVDKLGVKVYVETGPLEVFGLREAKIDKIKVSETGHDIWLEASVPKIRIHSDTYNIKGKAMYVYNVKGSGTLDITAYRGRLSAKLHLKATETGTEIDKLFVRVQCDKLEGNLQDASWPINNLLKTKGKTLVDSFQSEVQAIAKKLVANVLKDPLSKIKFDDLLQYMKDILSNNMKQSQRSGSNIDTEIDPILPSLFNSSVYLRAADFDY